MPSSALIETSSSLLQQSRDTSALQKLGVSFEFPQGFDWGVATAAFQIEGAADVDGRGPSVWDAAAKREPDTFYKRHSPAVAADFYHRYAQDVASMAALGIRSFRMSISWSRLLPQGRGRINEAGIAFYDRLFDLLAEHGIEAMVDLYHWDLPQALAEQGGFSERRIIDDFTAYAALCYQKFGDRVTRWSTMNEPSASSHFNPFSPAKGNIRQQLQVDHHALLMHYAAVRAFRESGRAGQIGAVTAYVPVYPRSLEPADVQAAALQQAYVTARWLDPMLLGSYPQMLLSHEDVAANLPTGFVAECEQAFEPIDFIGLNYYTPSVIGHKAGAFLESETAAPFAAQSDYGFVNYPAGLFDAMMDVKHRYGNPVIYLTENGLAHDSEKPGHDKLDDQDRIAYIREHLRAVNRCIKAGIDICGYYYWSLLDTFESTSGYRYKFGLLQVDYDTLERTQRQSWHYYRKCIANNAVE